MRALVWALLLIPMAACSADVSTGDEASTGEEAAATREPLAGRPSRGDTPLPCEVDEVLAVSCRGCHAAQPRLSAPMALVTHEDLMAPAVSQPQRRVYELMAARVHDHEAPMPPRSSRPLKADELAVLDKFVARDAPAGDEACATAATAQPDAPPPAPEELDRCYRLQAHDHPVAGDTTPYVAPHGEYYSCFYFDPPWEGSPQALSLRSLDTPLTHHWMLYDVAEDYEPGEIVREAESCGFGLREALGVFGAGQQREQNMPQGVGLKLPQADSGHGLLLEVHYFNPGEPVPDTTGVEVCTAAAPRERLAAVSTLGNPRFALPPGQAFAASGTCTPNFDGDIHILRSLDGSSHYTSV